MQYPSSSPPRLDAIATQWSLIQRAHRAGQGHTCNSARQELVLRYAPAIRGYLRAVLRQADDADEVAQDIIVKLMKGDFAGASPSRGRFRDFLRTALHNQVRKRWEHEKRRRPVDLNWDRVSGGLDPAEDSRWLAAWQRQVLDQAWAALENAEHDQPGSPMAKVLRLRTEMPLASSEELAVVFGRQMGRRMTPENLRQLLHRARQKFVELLREEVAAGLDDPSEERLREEFAALGLATYLQ